MKELQAKIREALLSALPVTAVVYLLSLTPFLDLSSAELITFSVGAVLLVVGIGLFSLGADLAMTPMGTQVGSGLSRQKKLGLLCGVCFLMGMLITIAEPDLQVLANQVSTVMNGTVLTGCVGFGVGAFLVLSVLKIVFRRSLSQILMLFYMLLFALSLILVVNGNGALLPLAFDSGGVTTGPITVPFIMALGVGIAGVLGDRRSRENSFGLVSLCSVGPVLAVLLLGIFSGNDLSYAVPDYTVCGDIAGAFVCTALHTCKEVAIALGMIVGMFLICCLLFLKLSRRSGKRIALGVIFTYIGLVLFLTGWRLPGFINDALSMMGNVTTPLAMFVIGARLIDLRFAHLQDWKLLLACALRLIIFPAAVLLLRFTGLPAAVVSVLYICTAMPCAATTAMQSEMYHCDNSLASRGVALSTAFSILTLPLMLLLA